MPTMKTETRLKRLGTRADALVAKISREVVNLTDLTRQLATIIVDVREACDHDWAGRSAQYRAWYSDHVGVLTEGLDDDSRTHVERNLRYHVQTQIKDRAPKKELKAAGLVDRTQSQRQADRSGGRGERTPTEILREARARLADVRETVAKGFAPDDRVNLLMEVTMIEVEVRQLMNIFTWGEAPETVDIMAGLMAEVGATRDGSKVT
jgi:hypothetical protein